MAQQPPQDSSVLTIDEIRQENNRATSSNKASTICMFSSVCLVMSAIGAGCLASGHPLEGAILTGVASWIGGHCVRNLFDYSNVSLSNQRINARENQAIGAPQVIVNAMDRSRDSIAISTQVNRLEANIVFRQQ